MEYKVITDTTAFSKHGINPTTKDGNNVGIVKAGTIFEALSSQNGWLSITYNRWVMASACALYIPEPPEPPDGDGDADDEVINIRKSHDGGITWYESKYYVEYLTGIL